MEQQQKIIKIKNQNSSLSQSSDSPRPFQHRQSHHHPPPKPNQPPPTPPPRPRPKLPQTNQDSSELAQLSTSESSPQSTPLNPPPPTVPPRPQLNQSNNMSPQNYHLQSASNQPLPQLSLSPNHQPQLFVRRTSFCQPTKNLYLPTSNPTGLPNKSPPQAIRPRFSSQSTTTTTTHPADHSFSTPPPLPPPKPQLPQNYRPPQILDSRTPPAIPSRTLHPAGPRDWSSSHINSPTHRSVESNKNTNNLSSLFSDPSPIHPRTPPSIDLSSLEIHKRISLTSNLGLGFPSSASRSRATRLDDSDEDEDDTENLSSSNPDPSRPNMPFRTFHPPPPPPARPEKRHLSRALSGSWLESPLNAKPIRHEPNNYRQNLYEPIGRVEDIPDPTFANRRPPCLNPSVSISIGSQFSSWALRGNWLCTGHHQLKLWHTGTGECLNQVNSFQDIKITCMEFKTSTFQGNDQKTSANNSRYVWCGTKDGQLFEFDCSERRIIDSKASLHSAPVIGLFRCKAGGMCSIDESGKAQIWSNHSTTTTPSSSVKISGSSRTQRIADKTNFVKMISHRLWTASGPSGSKTASAPAQRGPSIRVYDPDPTQAWTATPRPITIPEAVIGGVIVGTVTAGAVVPARPELVYLGHETGHVSVWEICLQNRPSNPLSPSQPQHPSKNHDPISSSTPKTGDPFSSLLQPPQRSKTEHLERSSSSSASSSPSSTTASGSRLSHGDGTIKFKKLIKLSNVQITSMEGVTKYLWVGFRTGFVYVYETEIEGSVPFDPPPLLARNSTIHHPPNSHAFPPSPSAAELAGSWKVLKLWKAHKDAVLKIIVDPSLLWDEVGKLHVATTSTDWKIKLWDGTMSVDWLASEMRKRQTEYCTYRPIKALICSWNVDACKPNELTGTTDNLHFLEDVLTSSMATDVDPQPATPASAPKPPRFSPFNHLGRSQILADPNPPPSSSNAPDLIVFGFQEMIDLENKKLTAKTVLLGGRKKAVGTNGGEKLSDAVSQVYRKWHDKLVLTVKTYMPPDDPYVVIHTENLVGLFTCVFVKSSERAKMRDIAITTVKTGMKGRYGNKGAILARLVIDDSSICFINCHLAAGQKHIQQRNSDLIDILEEKSEFPDPPENKLPSSNQSVGGSSSSDSTNGVYVGGGNGSAISDHEICFLQGDLNYRIDASREDVIRAIAAGEYCKLLEFDQLIKEKKSNPLFRLRSFYEPPIRFHPTYKYDPGTHMYDSSEKARVPAWCDRILYRTPGEEATSGSPPTLYIEPEGADGRGGASGRTGAEQIVENLDYRRYEVNISDHRPVSATFRIFVKSVVPGLKRRVLDHAHSKWADHEAQIIRDSRRYYSRF